jgi:hypothetical protein
MFGLYGNVRAIVFAFALVLIGMTIGGDGHQAASIVSHIFTPLFHHPFIATGLIIGIIIGCWMGQERAVTRIGEAEMSDVRRAIRTGSGDD